MTVSCDLERGKKEGREREREREMLDAMPIVLTDTFPAVRHWWLMPVILATQEAEIRRIAV
jgi:hypothetical protein